MSNSSSNRSNSRGNTTNTRRGSSNTSNSESSTGYVLSGGGSFSTQKYRLLWNAAEHWAARSRGCGNTLSAGVRDEVGDTWGEKMVPEGKSQEIRNVGVRLGRRHGSVLRQ